MPYAFTAEDFNKFTEDVLKAEGDQATLTTLLADMNGTITEAIAKDIASTSEVETVRAENERLKKANMDLFLRVGVQVESDKERKKNEEEEKPLSVNDYMTSYFNKLDGKGE